MSEDNGKSKDKVYDYITLPTWNEIQHMDISQLTEVRIKVEKYQEILSRIIRSKIN